MTVSAPYGTVYFVKACIFFLKLDLGFGDSRGLRVFLSSVGLSVG